MVKRLVALLALASCPQPGANSYFAHPRPYTESHPTARPAAAPRLAPSEALLADCRKAIASSRTLAASILALKGVHAVDNTVEPYAEIERQLDTAGDWADVVAAAHPDPAMRDAAGKCSAELDAEWSELWLDHRIYDALRSVDTSLADAETKRFVASVVRDMKRAGVELEDKGRARMQEIDAQLVRLARDFDKNLADDVRTIEVKDVAKLAGLPPDWVVAHPPDASGTIHVTTDYRDYVPVLTFADDDDLRKQLYIAFRSRGEAKNEQVIHEVLALRAEKALLLGYPSWADYASDGNMLRGGKAELEFLDRIQRIAAPRAKKDYAELLAQLKTKEPKATEVGEWQRAYLENQLRRDKYGVDPDEIRKYVAFDQALAAVIAAATSSFDVELAPVTDPKVWAADVKAYDVSRKGEKLGRIFLDLGPRAHKTALGAHAVAPGVKGEHLAEVAIVMNLRDHLDLSELAALFHEVGKAMHGVLGGRRPFARQSGLPSERDFVDAPAQAFEELAWSPDVLDKLGMSKELIDKVRRAERFGKGTWVTQQLLYAAVALRFHMDDPSKLDATGVFKQLQKKYTPFPSVDGTRPEASFEHLISYSSLYYTYLWTFVVSRDLLSAGKPLTTLVEAGGTKDAGDALKEFLGRGTGTKAFEKYLGEMP